MSRLVITGSPRSVTSYRCHVLNRSPDVCVFDEINLYGKDGMFQEGFKTNYERYFEGIAQQLKNKVLPHQKESPVLNEQPRNAQYTEAFLRGRFYQYLDREYEDYGTFCGLIENEIEEFICGDYKMVGDKMPLYINQLDYLMDYYPDMKVLLCVRDPFQIARSFYEKSEGQVTEWWQTTDVNKAVEQANEILQILLNSLRPMTEHKKERIYQARYEELEEHFEQQWQEILEFFDVREGRTIKWARNSFDYREYSDLSDTILRANDTKLSVLHSIRSDFGYGD